jgi:putative N6-adenine-specific DNA methylase
LRILYRKIGDVMKQRCSGHTAFIFTGNPELAKSVGLRPSWRKVLFNGPIECRLLKYVLY